MRFSCKNCGAQYNIADERVRGKVLKIRCKHCDQALIVRGTSEASSGDAAQAAAEAQAWHYGLDGQELGPVSLDRLQRMIASGEVSEEAFVWREGLDDWVPVEDVAELRGHLPSAKAARVEQTKAEQKKTEEAKGQARRMVGRKSKEDDGERQEVLAKIMQKRSEVRADRHAGRIAEYFFEDGENLSDVSELLPTETPEERAARETAERLHLQSIEEERQLLGPRPVADSDEAEVVQQVLVAQARVDSQGKRLGLALAAVSGVLLLLGALVAFAFQQGWVAGPVAWFEGAASEGRALGGLGQLDEDDLGDSASIRKALWDVERKRRAEAAQGRRSAGRVVDKLPDLASLGLENPVLSEEEKRLQAFYQSQAGSKTEVAPRASVENLAGPVGIDLNTTAGGVVGLPAMTDSKAESAPLAPEGPSTSKRLSEAQINFVIRRNTIQLKKCLDRQLKRDATISGKLVLGVLVQPDGKVSKVRVQTEKFHGTYLEECLVQKIKAWNFPPFEGQAYEIFFPLLLSARESY